MFTAGKSQAIPLDAHAVAQLSPTSAKKISPGIQYRAHAPAFLSVWRFERIEKRGAMERIIVSAKLVGYIGVQPSAMCSASNFGLPSQSLEPFRRTAGAGGLNMEPSRPSWKPGNVKLL
jgi:hypothetical protein